MQVRTLGWEDPLGEGMATHSGILAQRIPWTYEPGRLQPVGSQRVGHDQSDLACTIWNAPVQTLTFYLEILDNMGMCLLPVTGFSNKFHHVLMKNFGFQWQYCLFSLSQDGEKIFYPV